MGVEPSQGCSLETMLLCLSLLMWGEVVCVSGSVLSHVQLFVTPWTVACKAPLSMEFSRQGDWSGLPFPPPGDLPDPGIESMSPASLALAGGCFTTSATWDILHGLNCILPNSYPDSLTSNMTGFGDGTLGR